MLRVYKYLLFSVLFLTTSYGDILTWGDYTRIDINKNEVNSIIEKYVEKTYPKEVEEYNKKLAKIKQEKLDKISDKTFVHNKLMWQDTPKNTSLVLNQLEAKIYCKRLIHVKRKDWRLPTYKELLQLVDYSKADPASQELIQYINPSSYWSSTFQNMEKKSWYVDFSLGESGFDDVMQMKNLRCVRDLSIKKDDY